jgi:hypothetical protein
MFCKRMERHDEVQERGGHGWTLLGLALVVTGVIWGTRRLGWSITTVEWPTIVWPVVVAFISVLVLIKSHNIRTHRITKQEGI